MTRCDDDLRIRIGEVGARAHGASADLTLMALDDSAARLIDLFNTLRRGCWKTTIVVRAGQVQSTSTGYFRRSNDHH